VLETPRGVEGAKLPHRDPRRFLLTEEREGLGQVAFDPVVAMSDLSSTRKHNVLFEVTRATKRVVARRCWDERTHPTEVALTATLGCVR